METQVRVNTGGSVVGVVWRLNWSGPVVSTTPEKGKFFTTNNKVSEMLTCVVHVYR